MKLFLSLCLMASHFAHANLFNLVLNNVDRRAKTVYMFYQCFCAIDDLILHEKTIHIRFVDCGIFQYFM